MKYLVILATLFVITQLRVYAASDSVRVRIKPDSTLVTGVLVYNGSTEIIVRISPDKVKSIRRTDILDIQHIEPVYSTGTSTPGVDSSRGFLAVGATFGLPAVYNARIGFHLGGFSMHLSGMQFEDVQGTQVDVLFCLKESEHTLSYMGAVYGQGRLNNLVLDNNKYISRVDYSYVGLAGVYYSYAFLLEAGMAFGPGSTPLPFFQIGYLLKAGD